MGRLPRPFLTLILVLISSLLLYCFFAPFSEYLADDAYIHLRIARNLAQHGEPYFNLGEPVFASSSPLFVILLATLFSILDVNPAILLQLNALACVLSVLVFGKIIEIEASCSWFTSLILSAICLLGWLLVSAQQGMETPLAIFLFGFSLLLLLKGRSAAFFVLGIAVFCRLELWAALPIYLIACYRYRLVRFGAGLLSFVFAFTPLAVFCLCYYGTLIPNTVAAKELVYQAGRFNFSLFYPFRGIIGPAILAVLIGLIVIIYSRLRSRLGGQILSPAAFCLLSLGMAVLLVYGMKQVFVMSWYVPLLTVPLASAAIIISSYSRHLTLTLAMWALLLFPPTLTLINSCRSLFDPSTSEVVREGARTRRYSKLGALLYQRFPNARLLAAEIGGLGYTFEGKIIDGVGLATPSALRFHPVSVPTGRPDGFTGAIPIELIYDQKPEIIVAYDRYNLGFLASSIRSEYCRFEVPVFLDEDMRIMPEGIWKITTLPFWVNRRLLGSLKESSNVCPSSL